MTLTKDQQEEYDKETIRISRMKTIKMTKNYLLDIIYGKSLNEVSSDAPEGMEIYGVYYSKRLGCVDTEEIEIAVIHPDFEPVEIGVIPPELVVTFTEKP